jgi:hypothetical protein
MQSILQDLRFAVRRMVKDRWFTLAAITALALGLGANSAVFTIVNAVLLRGLPFDEPERIMWVDTEDTRGRRFGVSVDDYEDWRAATRTFTGIALVQSGRPNLSGDGRLPEAYSGGYITANAFDLIGVTPILGRGFVAGDDAPNAPPVVLISAAIWKSRYASDPDIIGKTVNNNANLGDRADDRTGWGLRRGTTAPEHVVPNGSGRSDDAGLHHAAADHRRDWRLVVARLAGEPSRSRDGVTL